MTVRINRNVIPGDETTDLVRTELTPEESDLREAVQMQLEILRMAEVAKNELERLQNTCKHHAFYDVAGFPYDTRYCAVCDVNLGNL